MRRCYEELGVEGYYESHGHEYRNPHFESLRRALGSFLRDHGASLDLGRVLDLACGSGEVTAILREHARGRSPPRDVEVVGADPHTQRAFRERTGLECVTASFEDLARGDHTLCSERFGVVVCSYAMHLADRSILPTLSYSLATMAPSLLLIEPTKKFSMPPTSFLLPTLFLPTPEHIFFRLYSSTVFSST